MATQDIPLAHKPYSMRHCLHDLGARVCKHDPGAHVRDDAVLGSDGQTLE